jgi:hypothetical protein
MIELLAMRAQHDARARWTRQADAYVKKHGIDMAAVNAFAGTLTIIDCVFFGNGYFRFADEADKQSTSAVVIEVYGEDDASAVDLCGWSIDGPCAFATFLGADALGMARITNAATWSFGHVLQIHRTPLGWLKAGCSGCCILDHRHVSVWLREALGPIMAEDLDHARQLYSWLNPPPFLKSRILVPRKTERRAA